MNSELTVAQHYTRGGLEGTILRALSQTGHNPDRLQPADLVAVDEFHVGGIEATEDLGTQMNLGTGLQVLDVGSGIGGPARYYAAQYQCKVTGVDLTEEFVQVARSLTRRARLSHLAEFFQSSALNLPFQAETFDRAYMIHVGMNIADKAGVFAEVRRVLKTGGIFAIFDFVRTADGDLAYPLPWASRLDTNFVTDLDTYRDGLRSAGFQIQRERSRRTFGIEFMERMIARAAQKTQPALGLHLLMGDLAPVMIENILAMMKEGLLEPVEILSHSV